MASYGFKGLRLSTPDEIREALAAISDCASAPIGRVNLRLHTRDLETLTKLTQGTSLTRLTAFCWSQSSYADDVPDALLQYASRAGITWSNRELYFEEHFDLPWYDWNGSHSESLWIRLSETYKKPADSPQWQPSPDCLRQFLSSISSSGDLPQGKTTSSLSENEWTHYYSAVIPRKEKDATVGSLLRAFQCSHPVARWELCGTAPELRSAMKTAEARQDDYPHGCFHLGEAYKSKDFGNEPHFITYYDFAVRPHWLIPVLNCSIEEAVQIAGRLLHHKLDCRMTVRSSFLAWKLEDGSPSPRTRGNEFHLHFERGTFKLFVGIEQFVESDPPVREVSPRFRELASRLGAELKPNNWMM